ncbi:hypothetical protein SEPCBS119000_005729 [Sporothrix epigloea]|uniref:Protein kinase domain-containing protein n=1 Tax=Sporothrix epigloea TaxID=1892477 RepID=A0ABP0E320_9PEZI
MFGKEAIEKVVQVLIEAVNSNSLLRDRLGLRGKAKFYTHPSRFVDNDDAPEPNDVAHLFSWYCNCLTSDDAEIAKMVVEYIFPEELTPVVLIDGLMSEIQPARDVIENRDRDVMCTSRAHVTAAVTKVYSCMIDKGIQYGFICTGQSYVFLHIPDDPSIVYYHLSVPIVDVCDDDETRLYKTAAAQVFVFVLQSFLTDLPPQSWHDAAANIGVWPLNSEDAQSQIIESACNRKNSRASAQEAQRRRSFERSPIRTLSSCKQSEIQSDCKESGNEAACSLPHQAASSQSTPALQQGVAGQGRIQDRSYCTHACLLGLANGGPMDKDCPNADSHRPKHISSSKFLRLLQAQLANDRGPDADIIPLHMSGAIGALFKVRLSAYGYTLVAKGMTRLRLERLEHERDVYRVLRPIQGKHVAVCLGLKDLILPYYYHGRAFTHLLFLSWAGRPLDLCLKEVSEEALIAAVTEAYKSIHHLRIIHFDAEVRNITYDKAPMIVDFERSKYIKRDSLGTTGLDGQSRKRKSDTTQQQKVDHFARELSAVVDRVSECYDDLRPSKQ